MKSNTKEVFQYSLAALIIVGFFAVLLLLVILTIPKENVDAILLALGALISAFSGVIGYFFGSSMSSAKKDATIASMKTTDTIENTNN